MISALTLEFPVSIFRQQIPQSLDNGIEKAKVFNVFPSFILSEHAKLLYEPIDLSPLSVLVPSSGRSTGKDMSNILGASDEEDEKIRLRDGDTSSGGPPPVIKRKSKRKLTKLDSDESDQEEDESEEFKLSE